MYYDRLSVREDSYTSEDLRIYPFLVNEKGVILLHSGNIIQVITTITQQTNLLH